MIYLKSLLYGLLSLIYGVPIGLDLVVLMNVLLGDVIQFGLVLVLENTLTILSMCFLCVPSMGNNLTVKVRCRLDSGNY